MFPDNNWYGQRYILMQYLGVVDREIFASLQHGWISQFNNPNYKKKRLFYPLLFWSKHCVDFYNKKKNYKVYSIGAPFLYLCKIFDKKKINNNSSKGTLVFPTHSSQDLKQETNHNLLIKDVEEKFEGPYTICFYYYDLNIKDITTYKKKNWRVVCCTRSRTDKYSLHRQYREINRHNTIVCGEFCSPLFYSMYLKKKTRVLFNSNERFTSYHENEKRFVKLYEKRYPELFSNFLSPNKGYELAKKELGFDSMKDKKELKKLLGGDSLIKNFLPKIFSTLYDFKYGSGLRKGKNLSKKELKKYIASALVCE